MTELSAEFLRRRPFAGPSVFTAFSAQALFQPTSKRDGNRLIDQTRLPAPAQNKKRRVCLQETRSSLLNARRKKSRVARPGDEPACARYSNNSARPSRHDPPAERVMVELSGHTTPSKHQNDRNPAVADLRLAQLPKARDVTACANGTVRRPQACSSGNNSAGTGSHFVASRAAELLRPMALRRRGSTSAPPQPVLGPRARLKIGQKSREQRAIAIDDLCSSFHYIRFTKDINKLKPVCSEYQTFRPVACRPVVNLLGSNSVTGTATLSKPKPIVHPISPSKVRMSASSTFRRFKSTTK
mmetsp:Transcript_7288/g.13631  ORF Transcript_7288/g.13631 Transcript_7288/m.13631 type:complete len:299 (-) Transcript_7288:459-1355(-)